LFSFTVMSATEGTPSSVTVTYSGFSLSFSTTSRLEAAGVKFFMMAPPSVLSFSRLPLNSSVAFSGFDASLFIIFA